MSDSGHDLLPHILTVLDSVDRLRQSAGEQRQSIRQVRVGTVNTATVPLLAPAIRLFQDIHHATQVEVIGAQQAQIQRAILDGSYDLGLVNYLEGDDQPPELRPPPCSTAGLWCACATTVRWPATAVHQRTPGQAADRDAVQGDAMHRYIHRLLQDQTPAFSYSTDGAEMGKLMVAEGLGITVRPDFSVIGDPLEQRGVITWRPIEGDSTGVQLVIQQLRALSRTGRSGDLQHQLFVDCARAVPGTGAAAARQATGRPQDGASPGARAAPQA